MMTEMYLAQGLETSPTNQSSPTTAHLKMIPQCRPCF